MRVQFELESVTSLVRNTQTLNNLRFENTSKLIAKLAKHRRLPRHLTHSERYSIKNCVDFDAPNLPGAYTIFYQKYPFITRYPITSDGQNELVGEYEAYAKDTIRKEKYRRWSKLASIVVTSIRNAEKRNVATYLRLNDEFPGAVENIVSGISPKPVKLSWHTKPRFDDTEFRYRLYPDQHEFSAWSKRKFVEYFFIGSGSHTFEVQTRYPGRGDRFFVLPVADYEFFIDRPFISKPVIYKASGNFVDTAAEKPNLRNLYGTSKALLIGITDFEKMSLLPYVDKDVQTIGKALNQHGFQITTVLGKKTRNDVMTAIENFLSGLQANDRVIIYFSTHGFQDKDIKSKAYIATYDCDPDKPSINCIELGHLENNMKRAIAKPVKHLLVILDACSAGLGVVAKSLEYKELTIATEAGSHMITAGMINQQAEMDNVQQLSTFTRYLAEGLSGAADYTNDQILSLTELLLFVRYEVARKTNGTQTPMIGRIDGSGEMIFQFQK